MFFFCQRKHIISTRCEKESCEMSLSAGEMNLSDAVGPISNFSDAVGEIAKDFPDAVGEITELCDGVA